MPASGTPPVLQPSALPEQVKTSVPRDREHPLSPAPPSSEDPETCLKDNSGSEPAQQGDLNPQETQDADELLAHRISIRTYLHKVNTLQKKLVTGCFILVYGYIFVYIFLHIHALYLDNNIRSIYFTLGMSIQIVFSLVDIIKHKNGHIYYRPIYTMVTRLFLGHLVNFFTAIAILCLYSLPLDFYLKDNLEPIELLFMIILVIDCYAIPKVFVIFLSLSLDMFDLECDYIYDFYTQHKRFGMDDESICQLYETQTHDLLYYAIRYP